MSMTRPVTTPAVAPTAAKPSSFNMLRRPLIVLFCLTWPLLFLRRDYRRFPPRPAAVFPPRLTALLHRRVVADQPDHRRAHHHRAFREVAPRPVQVTAPATMTKKNAPGGGKRNALVR